MSWSSYSVASLPNILAGPIVRKVTPTEVNVWVAMKSGEPLTLNIYDTGGQIVEFSSAVTPTQVGANLYITNIRITAASSFLSTGQNYGYNIVNSLGDDFFTPGFADASGISALIYGSSPTFGSIGQLPSFVLPSSSLDDFRILHGSCRKPHGEGVDGMSTISPLIEESLSNPSTYERPQMLFLTGDQIYADDVADSLLFMIREYGGSIFGWSESHPQATNTDNLKPGYRHNYIMDVMNFTTTRSYSKSHLMGLQEYILMYIMAWSPSLWRPEPSGMGPTIPDVPDFDQVLPDEDKYEADYKFTGLLMTAGPPQKETEIYSTFETEVERIRSYRNTLPQVRKAMANIATYMIFDDHEVTDDWFLNYSWTQNALTANSLQRRVILNGMTAYALCQGWGNTPEQFEIAEPGATLLSKIDQIAASNNSVSSSVWDTEIADIVLPYLETGSSLRLRHNSGGLKYNWAYSGVDFEVIALDTRSQRAYFNQTLDKGIAYLMSNEAVDAQVRNIGLSKKDLTILVSGTPLYGSGTVEKSIEGLRAVGAKSNPDLDLESWNIVEYARHTLISALATRGKTPANSGDPLFHRVVVLSGDVHYGFTNEIRYTASNTFKFSLSNVEMRIIQCCASSFKNQLSPADALEETLRLTTVGWHRHDPEDLFLYESFDNFTHWGYNNYNGTDAVKIEVDGFLLPELNVSGVTESPFIVSSNGYIEATANVLTGKVIVPVTTFDWKVVQTSKKAFPLNTVIPAYTAGVEPNEYFGMSSNHQDNYIGGGKGGRYIVGYNQVGECLFRWPDPDPQFGNLLDHRLWWRNRGQSGSSLHTAYPLSIYVVRLG